MKILTFAVLFHILSFSHSYALDTGNEWLAKCENEDSSLDQGLCAGYLKGLKDAEFMHSQFKHISNRLVKTTPCLKLAYQ